MLYWFDRDDGGPPNSRLGIAVRKSVGTAVVRNRIKRQLRELWRSRAPARAADYVLVVRPGLPEAADARGFEWLGERVSEVVAKADA